jgi:RNA polymerase sigma factor (sigma-70 family)
MLTTKTSSKRQWEMLVRALPQLRRYVRRMGGNDETIDDVLQEVSLRALVSEGPTDDHARFLAWSFGIARHVAAQHARRRKKTGQLLPFEEDAAPASALPDPVTDPEGHVDARTAFARAVLRLDADSVELLVRRYLLGETGEELADERAESSAAIRMRLMRLRATIRTWGGMTCWLLAAQACDLAPALELLGTPPVC